MLAVILFILFWVVLGAAVVFIAGSGGPAGARRSVQTPNRTGRRVIGVTMIIIYIGFGVLIPLLVLDGNHANASKQVGGLNLTPSEKRGREIFAFRCGTCHTLAAANSVGKVGPNLDSLKPPSSLVLNTINNGCLQNPPTQNSPQSCLGQGNMPAGIIQGRDAREVAAFVSKVAGKE